jgi:hypothetical protein
MPRHVQYDGCGYTEFVKNRREKKTVFLRKIEKNGRDKKRKTPKQLDKTR